MIERMRNTMSARNVLTDSWNYSDMLADITEGRRFAYARYCDGEWSAIFNRRGGNCDGHKYFPDMGKALESALITDPENGYHVGIMPGLLTDTSRWWPAKRVIKYVDDHRTLSFCGGILLHGASMSGRMGMLFESLVGQRCVIVGNRDMNRLHPWIEIDQHIEVPEKDCWNARDRILPRIIEAAKHPGIILFACSMPAKVWIRKTWEANGQASLLDIGAALDPYAGRLSRNYMKDGHYTLAEIIY